MEVQTDEEKKEYFVSQKWQSIEIAETEAI